MDEVFEQLRLMTWHGNDKLRIIDIKSEDCIEKIVRIKDNFDEETSISIPFFDRNDYKLSTNNKSTGIHFYKN